VVFFSKGKDFCLDFYLLMGDPHEFFLKLLIFLIGFLENKAFNLFGKSGLSFRFLNLGKIFN